MSSHQKTLKKLKRALMLLGALLAGMSCGAVILALVLAGEIYDYQDTVDGVHLPAVDAVVCLAGGRGRIAAAGDIWYRYWETGQPLTAKAVPAVDEEPAQTKVPVLYVSGMGHLSNWNVFARQLRRGVLGVIRPENVVLETESFNTDANARWLARYARAHHWTRILLITSRYHMRRAHYIFDRTFKSSDVPVSIETLSVYQEPFEPGEWRSGLHGIRVTLLEYFKWIFYTSMWHPE